MSKNEEETNSERLFESLHDADFLQNKGHVIPALSYTDKNLISHTRCT